MKRWRFTVAADVRRRIPASPNPFRLLTSAATVAVAEMPRAFSRLYLSLCHAKNGTLTMLRNPCFSVISTIIPLCSLGVSIFLTGCSTPAPTNQNADRAAWMPAVHWGVMTHYLADWRAQVDHEPASVEHWNELIDHFDVEGLANQLQSVGAGY